jgi:enolase-phosphatase E1
MNAHHHTENIGRIIFELELNLKSKRKFLYFFHAIQLVFVWHHYKNADYKAHIYNDAIQKLVEWREKNIKIFVYSSGSIQAQKLFFQYSLYGDARSLFNDYFDTTIGVKKNQDSYKKISQAIGISSGQILFLSDIESELNAAKNVGYDTCWVIRPDDSEVDIETIQSDHQVVSSFYDIKI